MKKLQLFRSGSAIVSAITICFLLLLCSNAAFSQATAGTVSGTLKDEKGIAVKYANISLLRAADSALVKGAVTGDAGSFSIPGPVPGTYFIKVTAIGFSVWHSPSFELTAESASRDFGTITVKEDARALKDVTVKALRPTITQLADRMVVSVQGTALAAGSTAFDVLARSPGVFIDHEGNIQLNGRSGVTVMIDGKLTYLSARDLRNMLESMTAENIKNIEIITNPSAKYDAEGSSGILNINLRKNEQKGMNGSIFGGYMYNGKDHGYSGGALVNHKVGKWNSFLNLDFARRVGGREATFTRIFYGTQETTYFDQVAEGNFHAVGPPAIRIGTDYSINDRHSIGTMINYTANNSWQDFLTDTRTGNAPHQRDMFIEADNISTNKYRNFTSNLHYQGKLDTLGTTLTTDLDFVKIRHHGNADFFNYYTNLNTGVTRKDFLFTDIPSGYDIFSAKTDYSRPLSRDRKLELGAKASRVISDNDSRFYFNNNGLVLDPRRTNHFNYRESIFAGYINLSGSLGKTTMLQAGLRGEHTRSVGNSISTGVVTRRQYTNFFPSVFLQQKVSENYGLTLSYTRRIQRPNYGNLNPFRFYRDPYTYVEGNPYLKPSYAHVFSLNQTFKKNYTLILSYQVNKDFMAELPRLEVDSATTIYYTGNVDGNYSMGATGILPVRIAKFWDVQNTVTLSYSKYTIEVNKQMLINDQLYYSLQSMHTLMLPKDIRSELTFLYQGPAAYGLYQIAPRSRFDIGLKKSFFKKKVDLSVNAIDIFKGQRLRFKTDINGNINDFDQYLRPRNFNITLRYHFSRGQKVDTKRRSTTVEEVNRT